MANLRVDKITSTETFETTGSVQFDGTGDYLSIPNSNDFAFGTGDFTIEMWLYASSSGSYQTPIDFRPTATNGNYPALIRDTDGDLYYFVNSSRLIDNVSISNDVWYHVAICREGTTTRLYLDGILKGSASDSTNYITDDINISSYKTGGNYFHGYISNLRVIKGKALYTENFKVPMRELENIPGTVILACQSKTNTILEKTGKTITVTGSAVASELSPGLLTPVPKSGGGSAIKGSVEFTGTAPHPALADYLGIEKSSDFAFGTGDFTIEMWVYHSDITGQQTYFGDTYGGTAGIYTYKTSNNEISLYDTAQRSLSAQNVIKANEWHHVAWTRESGTLRAFLDGIKVDEDTYTGNFTNTQYYIGNTDTTGSGGLKGFISNLRVNKGTALYTEEFIPPTRELKKVPGTVLLCCQDPDSALTEATGKTITGYGDLHEATDVEMLTNGSFAGGYSTEWEAKNNANLSYSNGELTVTSTQNYSGVRVKSAYLPSLIAGRKYVMTIDLKSITNPIRFGVVSGLTVSNISTAGRHSGIFTASAVTEIFIEKPDGSNSTFVLKSVSIRELNTPNGASNFTPQVGDDRKVTFEGVTKVNSDAYFYLPTGDTASREATGSYSAGTRGLFSSGNSPGMTNKAIDYITIASTGDALDFGDLSVNSALQEGGCASHVRGLFTGLITPARTSNIEYVTISSTNDTNDFGDLTRSDSNPSALSNSTRGVFFGGATISATYKNIIDYVTISSTGAAQDFGDMTAASYVGAGAASPTRGILAGGYNGSSINSIEYVTISSTGNAKDFGDLLNANSAMAGASNAIRAVFAGGETPTVVNTIQYLTISTTGNTFDFGDLPAARRSCGGASSSTRMVIAGGFESPSQTTEMEYVNIATTSNTFDFGDLVYPRMNIGGLSNGHGGLG